MNKTDFFKELKNILDTEENLTEDTLLLDIDEWDSLAYISIISFLEKEFGKKIAYKDVQDYKSVKDIMDAAGL